MELYGGGMTGQPKKYATGGAISRARLSSAALGDRVKLKKAAEENQDNMSFWSNLGAAAGFAADMYMPGLGGPVRAVTESFYEEEEPEDVMFGLESKDKLSQMSDDYRSGIFGRGAVSSLSSMMMPEIYEDLGAKIGMNQTSLPEATANIGADIPMIFGEEGARNFGIGGNEYKQLIEDRSKALTYGPDDYNPYAPENQAGDLDADYWWDMEEGGSVPEYFHGGQVHNSNTNQYGVNTDALGQLNNSGFNMGNVLGGAIFGEGSGLSSFQDPNNLFTPGTGKNRGRKSGGTFNPTGDYGRQRSVDSVLRAAGMEDKLDDPEFAEYMKYLPSFEQGYEQEIADYRTGAQGSLMGMTAPMGVGETTFSGSGAVNKARTQARGQTTDIYKSKERGVGERYTADVLSALTAAETLRETPFGVAADGSNMPEAPQPPAQRHIADQFKVHAGRNWKWNLYEWEDMGPA